MKKIKWLLLSFSFLLFLAACGQGEDNDATTGEEPVDAEEQQEDTEDNTEENITEENTSEENADVDSSEENSELADEDAANEGEADEEVAKVENAELYFSDDQLMDIYRVVTDLSVTQDQTGAQEVYELWLAGPTQENLVSLVPETTQVQSVTFEGDVARVSFNSDILDANLGSSGEAMLVDQIAMLAHQFGFEKTQILIDGEVPENFLGHMDVSEPFEANNPEDYETVE